MPATARDLLADKNSSVVYTVEAQATVAEACRLLEARGVGALLVTEDDRILGILSGRDVVTRVVAPGRDAGSVRVAEVMTREVATVRADEPVERVEALMRARHIGHVPVAGPRGLLGILSRRDLAAWRASPGIVGEPPGPPGAG